jgi:hypothetical protein
LKRLACAVIACSLTTTIVGADSSDQADNHSQTSAQTRSRPAVQAAGAKAAGKITEAQACETIARRPEVKSWKRQVVAAKSKGVSPHIELNRTEGGEHVVHVYEDVPDGDGSSHTATFNWYYVNQKNGKVRKEF